MGDKAAVLRGELRELVKRMCPRTSWARSPMTPPTWRRRSGSAGCSPSAGLLCLSWPKEFGGGGASVWEQTVVREEMWAHHEPRGAQYMGVNWVGPIIMRHGTEEQQRKHLPPIARGEVIWCQGFSEPEAGSDLASLRTTARRDGDGWRVSGQKIWTSYATMAQWCFLLARTSKGEKKQQGLTIFLVPMDDAAIQVRPIRCMMGPHHLNEVFFDDLRVTEADVLGTVDQGWSIVQDVMSFERVGIARYARCERLLAAAPAVLGDRWDQLPAELRGRWVRMLTHCRRARLLAYRVVSLQSTGRMQPGDAAAYRIAVTKLDQDSAEVLMDIAAEVTHDDPNAAWFRGRGRGPLALLAGVHCLVRQHRDAADPVVPRPVGGRQMILDLSDDAKEYGRQALRAFEAAGGDQLVQQAEAKPAERESLDRPGAHRARRVGARCPYRRRRTRGRGGTVPQRRLLGTAVSGGRATGAAHRPRRRWPDRRCRQSPASGRCPQPARRGGRRSKHAGPQSRWPAPEVQ